MLETLYLQASGTLRDHGQLIGCYSISMSAKICGTVFMGRKSRFGGLDEFQANLTTDNRRSFLKSAQGHGAVPGIKQPVERGTAGMHPARHLDLGEAFLLHGSRNLPGNDPFDRGGADFLIEAFLAKPVVEG